MEQYIREDAPSTELLMHAFEMFDKHGLIRDDLCFDPEHFMDTVIRPHWFDGTPDEFRLGQEVIIFFMTATSPLNNSVAEFLRLDTETGTKMAVVIDENGDERKVPLFDSFIREKYNSDKTLVEVNDSVFFGVDYMKPRTTLGHITCRCIIPSLGKSGYLVKHYKAIRGERFVEDKDIIKFE
jgi:hypothetical protein